jgi:DNA repair protein RecN (Recombination protein N)
MIRQLIVSNYILIDKLELTFEGGLHIITGETGAGKSILMGALDLISGERADPKALRNPDQKCFIEAWFRGEKKNLESILVEEGIENEEETIIRREILQGGKSRAFVNDTPVNLEVLRKIGNQLLDIHGQQDTRLLGSAENQLGMLDALAGTENQRETYQSLFFAWHEVEKKLAEKKETKAKEEAEFGYKQFVFNELDAAQLKPGEQEELEKEASLLRNAEGIKIKLNQILETLEGQIDIPSQIKMASQTLEKLAGFSIKMEPLAQRTKSLQIELQDILGEIRELEEAVLLSPERLLQVEERLSQLFILQKKYRKETEAELIEYYLQIGNELEAFQHTDEAISALESELKEKSELYLKYGHELSETRKKAIPEIEQSLHALLADMALEKASFKIELQENKPSSSGLDKIQFLFSANPGKALSDLKSVASGGEFSRLMLALKALLARKKAMPTLIFDEIDTGISGEVAMKVGLKIKEMARFHQVFAITHSAQMASQADAHWFVFKSQEGNQTLTSIKKLDQKERLTEIAKMISGSKISDAAIEAARVLVESNHAQG